MMSIFKSLTSFISSLGLIDIIFFTAVMILIILIIVMIYIMRSDAEINFDYGEVKSPQESNSEVIKNDSPESLDLASISKELDEAPAKTISLTPYEEEQEERAIISYDELVSNTGKIKLNYEEEQSNDGLVVKKVDLDNLNTPDMDLPKLASNIASDKSVPVISYAKEEDFLATLKKLQKMLY